jgi:hypothetical protein
MFGEDFYIKDGFIYFLLCSFAFIAVFCLVRKIYLFVRVERKEIGFFPSFYRFASKHDISGCTKPRTKKFLKANNWLTAFFWISLLAFAFTMAYNTSDKYGIIMTRDEAIRDSR